uniref:Uncharacterized protein n=1 Tax=Glypta fumiferanae TaxID=389681 RepID=A0A0F6T1F7_9HYME|nr:hypothetical protein [Glypta fumiferanae]
MGNFMSINGVSEPGTGLKLFGFSMLSRKYLSTLKMAWNVPYVYMSKRENRLVYTCNTVQHFWYEFPLFSFSVELHGGQMLVSLTPVHSLMAPLHSCYTHSSPSGRLISPFPLAINVPSPFSLRPGPHVFETARGPLITQLPLLPKFYSYAYVQTRVSR